VYRWDAPWVSIGCFVPLAEAQAAFCGRQIVRRWTGGGIVDHAGDWTYSLIVPAGEKLSAMSTAESYRAVHQSLAEALTRCGWSARLADADPPGLGGLCFQSPVPADVLVEGRKVAGAAQRRTRRGLLHQGSVQNIHFPPSLAAMFASALHDHPQILDAASQAECLRGAEVTVRGRYDRIEWLHRR
jgi:lipoyl(octanoyl) transferase